jgi:serine/threonine-protein kinase
VDADPRIGTELGGYRIEALIGRGASGGVYVAEQTRLGRKVALKVLSAELAADAVFRERFVRESHLAAGIEHPAIVPVFDAGTDRGTLYISMRLVEGSDLATQLASGPLDSDRALRLVGQIADALDFAHARGLVHRDVKPANILLASGTDGGERAFLSDFGIAKRSGSLPDLTQTGQFVGTVDYVAPEQIRGAEVDGRADQYSLGCVLYHCLTGKPPFPRPSSIAVIYAHLNDDPTPPSQDRPELTTDLDRVVLRALAKAPEDRHVSCSRLALVDRAEVGRDTPAAATGARRQIAQPGRPRPGARFTLAVGALLVVVALVVALVVLPRSSSDGGGGATNPPLAVEDLIWTEVVSIANAALGGPGEQAILGAAVTQLGIVAVGYRETPEGDLDAATWTSSDGRRWGQSASFELRAAGDQIATGVAQLGDSLVAVGCDASVSCDARGGDEDAAVWISTDGGSIWVRSPQSRELDGPGDQAMRRVVEIDGELVAVGYDVRASGRDQDMAVWTSGDGLSWTRADTRDFVGPEAQEADGVAEIAGSPVAVGSETLGGDQDAAVWLLDGTTWFQVHSESLRGQGNQRINEVVTEGPRLVAVGIDDASGSEDAAVWTSADGEEWGRAPSDPSVFGGDGNQGMYGVAVVGNELVAVGTDGSTDRLDGAIWTSPDGIAWTRLRSPSVAALGGLGQQYLIEILAFGEGAVALGWEARDGETDADVWLALPAQGG